MSVDMNSQGSDSNEEDYDPNCEEEEEDEDPGDIEDYYDGVANDVEQQGADAFDPEEYQFTCLTYKESESTLNEHMASLAATLKVSHAVAKLVLVSFHWQISEILERHKSNAAQLLVEARVQPTSSKHAMVHSSHHCAVCMQFVRKENLLSLACQHQFCRSCWEQHCTVLVKDGVGVGVSCMAQDCLLRTPEDFVFPLLPSEELKDKYRRYLFRDYVESHFQLQLCPGADCPMVIQVQEPKARRVQCNRCNEVFCFKCRQMYHAPTDCATIRKWLTKCADDSETANYISAHTKDCPKCNICIEKNGGCNHMQCSKCKHGPLYKEVSICVHNVNSRKPSQKGMKCFPYFCWMCLGDWKTHGSEYYECSRYKENPDIVNQSQQAQAREALKKYLFYFERWENHNKSLQLEAQTYQRIQEKIQERVMNNLGTWIDWQYLQNAAKLLAKCRYTLQYTYPYAYYMESGPRKKLFEYQQAQLEAEIENLSWKVERADSYDRGDLENQMHIAEQRRRTLLKDFHDT
ncbi:E3 ubiquitin-protein ligase ARIH2 isoform X2 [Struthio camelus]|uniref:E3 ubiquitin-protein ligase ARIH2 isoform X2 n=2 Tax=Struthio camelus TaxID=8801 RepID=UPI00051E4392|nr:PREDICTED: E3 ubiquitin-protein ligase ARIH2 isoform X1 [Struthio camelus australis]XP_009674137.1 PREDICTED: E3 ubiquitin-protein ligase ARIH2 isoform X1 [Struthio camelus australis]